RALSFILSFSFLIPKSFVPGHTNSYAALGDMLHLQICPRSKKVMQPLPDIPQANPRTWLLITGYSLIQALARLRRHPNAIILDDYIHPYLVHCNDNAKRSMSQLRFQSVQYCILYKRLNKKTWNFN